MWAGPDVIGRVYTRNEKGVKELSQNKVQIPEGTAMAQYTEPKPTRRPLWMPLGAILFVISWLFMAWRVLRRK